MQKRNFYGDNIIINIQKKRPIKFLIALEGEAQPIIKNFNLYRLKIRKSKKKIYLNKKEKIFLIVSGMGLKNAKESVGIINKINETRDCTWVNIGLAGHKNIKEGSLFEIKKITTVSENKTLFTNIFMNNLRTQSLCSVDKEEKIYANDCLYDMEGYGYLEILDKITDRDNIFFFKVVSDNLLFKPKNYKDFAFKNITNCLKQILPLIEKHSVIVSNNDKYIKELLLFIKNKYHVTFYNEKKVIKLLSKVLILKDIDSIKNEIDNTPTLLKLIKKYEFILRNYLLKV